MKHLIASVGAALLLTAQAQAAEPRQTTVSYSDLDLGNDLHAQAMVERLSRAAKQVCGPAPIVADLSSKRHFESCVQETMDRTVRSIGHANLARVYDGARVQRLARS